jgi:hypothetical protein
MRCGRLRVPINTGRFLVSFRGFAAEGVPQRRSGGIIGAPAKLRSGFVGNSKKRQPVGGPLDGGALRRADAEREPMLRPGDA